MHLRIGTTIVRSTLVGALLAFATMASAQTPAKVSDGVFVTDNGMTLYVFDRDPTGGGKSACNGPCATNWPPLMAMGDAKAGGDWTIIVRDDGSKQWAYKGRPLYAWAKDQKPGDRTGDGFLNNQWHVAKP